MSRKFSKLTETKLLRAVTVSMHNIITNFVRIRQICKKIAGNRVNERAVTVDDKKFLYFHLKLVLFI